MTEAEHIQKGFNAGYRLQQLNPNLSQQTQKGFKDQSHPYATGFIAGSEQYTKDITKTKTPSKETGLNKIRLQLKNKRRQSGKDNSKGKGINL